ncbi:hypothetical protein BLOT_002145, partial [Blomia tropicalis]
MKFLNFVWLKLQLNKKTVIKHQKKLIQEPILVKYKSQSFLSFILVAQNKTYMKEQYMSQKCSLVLPNVSFSRIVPIDPQRTISTWHDCGDELVVTDLRSQVHHQSDMTNNSVHDSFGTKLNPMASSTTNSKISNGSIEKLMKPPLPKKVPNDGMNIDMETFNRAETGYVIDTT